MHERLLPDDPQVSRSAGSPFATSISPACGEIRQPGEIASRIYLWSHGKTTLPLNRLLPLGILGGVYIGLGGALATLAMSESSLGAGPTRWLGGIAFSLGLVLVVIGGAELSTGNCLMVMARMRGLATSRQLWRNWSLSYAANAAEPLHSAAIHIAEAKLALTPTQAFLRGVLANILVCLAVWQAMASQSVIGKVVGIVFPISAFVALGFEHSIANLYLIPAGLMVGAKGTFGAVICNLGPVTAGNVVGGAVVAAGLWLGHGRGGQGPGT
jgi:formate/nitrite transporter FocA (FNT family)